MTTVVTNLVIDTVNAQLTEDLYTFIDKDDPTLAKEIRAGLLQDDPTQFNVVILTFPNDPDDQTGNNWRHMLAGEDKYYNGTPYEIGGGEQWVRRFTTKLELYWNPNVKRQDAIRYSNIVLHRCEYALQTVSLHDLTDDYGEAPLQLNVRYSNIFQAGGEGQFIHHGKIWWSVLTGKSF